MSRHRAFVAAVIALLLGAAQARAGRVNNFQTSVNLVTREAFGSLYDTRVSADNVQYIGCAINLVGGAARVTCEARNAANDTLTCGSANAELVKIAQAIGGDSYVFFSCDAGFNLTYLYVSNNSVWLP